ncbi:MAG: hypothetical protein ACJ8GW_07590, partial [Massilia sp.]
AIHNGKLERMPQMLPAIRGWAADAAATGILTGMERNTLADFAYLTDALIQVDDFAPDYAHPQATPLKGAAPLYERVWDQAVH